MTNFFTYEVLTLNRDKELLSRTPFNTNTESKIYFEIQAEENDIYCIRQIRIKNGVEREILKEHINDW